MGTQSIPDLIRIILVNIASFSATPFGAGALIVSGMAVLGTFFEAMGKRRELKVALAKLDALAMQPPIWAYYPPPPGDQPDEEADSPDPASPAAS